LFQAFYLASYMSFVTTSKQASKQAMIMVSKATKRHCAGTVQSQGGRVRNVKQVSFEPGPEDSFGRRGSDKIRQTDCS